MLERGKVSNWQLAFLLPITVIIATGLIFVPSVTATQAKQDGWLSVLLLPTAAGLVLAWVIVKLAARFPTKTLVEFAPLILGSWLGKLVGAGYVFWFIHVNAIVVREFNDLMITAFMPETPVLAFSVMILGLGALAAAGGLEVICRSNEWIFPLLVLAITAIVVLSIPGAEYVNLLPVLEYGIKPVLEGSLLPIAWRCEIVLLLMLLPYTHQSPKTGWSLAAAIVGVGFVLTAVTLTSIAVLGSLTENLTFATLTLTRYISVAMFIERVEPIILIMWVASVIIKVSIFYYAAALGAGQLFGLSDYKPLLIPLGLIMAVWSQSLFANIRELITWLSVIFPYYAYTFEIMLPLLLLVIAAVRKKDETDNAS